MIVALAGLLLTGAGTLLAPTAATGLLLAAHLYGPF
jgi:hypothetical protein